MTSGLGFTASALNPKPGFGVWGLGPIVWALGDTELCCKAFGSIGFRGSGFRVFFKGPKIVQRWIGVWALGIYVATTTATAARMQQLFTSFRIRLLGPNLKDHETE